MCLTNLAYDLPNFIYKASDTFTKMKIVQLIGFNELIPTLSASDIDKTLPQVPRCKSIFPPFTLVFKGPMFV